MFGKKKNQFDLRMREVFAQVAEQREGFEIAATQIEEAGKRIKTDIEQVMKNTDELVAHSMTNIETESNLIHDFDEFSKELRGAVSEYQKLAECVEKQHEATMALVDENKHYTTPARYITEAPAELHKVCQVQEKRMEDLLEASKHMGVLSLNAAIEAGRLGEEGKSFVEASEEIRQSALGLENTVLAMKEDLEESQTKIKELEETIHHLVSLIKEGNKGTNRLLKASTDIHGMLQDASMREFSDDCVLMRDKVVSMRNLDEEIAKCGERNKIQLSDIQEDLHQQKTNLAELESDLSHVLDIAEAELK